MKSALKEMENNLDYLEGKLGRELFLNAIENHVMDISDSEFEEEDAESDSELDEDEINSNADSNDEDNNSCSDNESVDSIWKVLIAKRFENKKETT